MRKLALVAAAASILFTGAATAADLAARPYAKAPVAPPVQSWAGFYIGGHGGYGWKDDSFSETISTDPLVTIDGIKARGWVAGGHFGYNWQYGAVVGGLELDISATGIKGSTTAIVPLGEGATLSNTRGDNVKLLGSARGRLGYAPNSDWLLYGTGGLAWERLDQTSFNVLSTFFTQQSTGSNPVHLFGWVAGAGVEARLMGSNWIGRLEYLHYDFGQSRSSSSTLIEGQSFGTPRTGGDQTIDVVRAGLSYKFGDLAVVANY